MLPIILSTVSDIAARMAANALVGSQLNYCNFLFRSLSALIFASCKCVQTVLLETHITHVRKTPQGLPVEHYAVFKTALLVYRSYKVVILNIFSPFFKLDTVCTMLIEVKLTVWCLRSHTLSDQYIS